MLSTNYVSTINSQWTKSCQNTQMCIVGKAREAGGKKISGFFGTTLCSSTLYPGTLWCQSIFIVSRTCLNLPTLGLAKRDLWGLGAKSWFVVASYAFAKMIPPLHRGAFCQSSLQWIYYYGNNKSTGKETGKTHLCALHDKRFQSSDWSNKY